MKLKLFVFLCLACGAVAQAAPQAPTVPPLAARFALTVNKINTDWYLWRDANSVETADLASGQNQIWERLGEDDYSYQRVFNTEQRIVEYTPGEIRTRNAEPDWAKLSSVLAPPMLTQLKRGPSKTLFGQSAVRYTGVVNGQSIKLWWLPQAQLPAQLEIRGEAQSLSMTLKELHAQAPAAWPRASASRVASYARMDAADFGDMETDPFVARVMQMDGQRHTH